MPSVQTFTQSMIKTYLDGKNLRYLVDNDGDFLVRFSRDEDTGCELSIYFIAAGQKKEIFAIRIDSDREIPKSNWAQVMLLCNEWNREKRWPKVYLNNKDANTARIVCEEHIDLQTGVHQELLNDYADTAVASAFQFWVWLHKEHNI